MRLLKTMALDLRLQFRNGFYYAAVVVVVTQVAVLSWLSAPTLVWLLPVVLLGNYFINGLFFIAGLVMLEKSEGSLEALITTPLRSGEYLLSKVLSLCLLSLIESVVIIYSLGVVEVDLGPLLLGIVLSTALLSLFGFLIVARYDSINEFLFPSVLWSTALVIPYLGYFGIWQGWPLYLHPIQAPLLLLEAAFRPVTGGN